MSGKRPFHLYISRDKSWFTLSNALTCARVLLAPFVMVGIAHQAWGWAFLLLVVASITDLLDGYVARLCNQQTHLGVLLDPIADKFFILCCFYALVFLGSPSFKVPAWFFIMECVREVTILGGSYLLIRFDSQFQIAPTILGKLTTFFQISFICWLFVCRFFQWNPVKTFIVFFIALTLFSVWSLLHYIVIGWLYVTCQYAKK